MDPLSVRFWHTFLAAPSRLSYPGCSVLAVLSWRSHLALLSWQPIRENVHILPIKVVPHKCFSENYYIAHTFLLHTWSQPKPTTYFTTFFAGLKVCSRLMRNASCRKRFNRKVIPLEVFFSRRLEKNCYLFLHTPLKQLFKTHEIFGLWKIKNSQLLILLRIPVGQNLFFAHFSICRSRWTFYGLIFLWHFK